MDGTKTDTEGAPLNTESAEELVFGHDALERYREQAMAIPRDRVVPLRVVLESVIYNIRIGTNAVLAERERIARELPAFDLARAGRLHAITQAVRFMAHRARTFDAGRTERQQALVATVKSSHRLIFRALQFAVGLGLIPSAEVKNLGSSRNQAKLSHALEGCLAVFKKYAHALTGNVTVSAATLRSASESATNLLQMLTPKGAKHEDPRAAEAELRDRVFTLMLQEYEPVRAAGAWLFTTRRDEVVPDAFSYNTRGPVDAVEKAKAAALKSEKETAAALERVKKRESKKAAFAEANRVAVEAKKIAAAAKKAARAGLPIPQLGGAPVEVESEKSDGVKKVQAYEGLSPFADSSLPGGKLV